MKVEMNITKDRAEEIILGASIVEDSVKALVGSEIIEMTRLDNENKYLVTVHTNAYEAFQIDEAVERERYVDGFVADREEAMRFVNNKIINQFS